MDKLYHLIAGCIIALVVGSALFYLTSILAGAIKETIDAIRAKAWNVKTWNMFDFLATCVGGFAGVGILIVGFGID
jgi:hypothetical protein